MLANEEWYAASDIVGVDASCLDLLKLIGLEIVQLPKTLK